MQRGVKEITSLVVLHDFYSFFSALCETHNSNPVEQAMPRTSVLEDSDSQKAQQQRHNTLCWVSFSFVSHLFIVLLY